jgi:hypothetical protein
VAFSFIIAISDHRCGACAVPLLAIRGLIMAYKPWYERAAELNGAHEVEEFMRGMFGGRPKDKQPIITGLIAGYVGGKVAGKSSAKARKKK